MKVFTSSRILCTLGLLFLLTSAVFCSAGELLLIPPPSSRFVFWAFLLGGLSAISLVIGALMGLIWKPSPRVTASFTAFGAGALLAALSVELIAPTVMEFVETNKLPAGQLEGHGMVLEFVFLIGGCILGGILFYFLNEALNSSGGYLRKASTTISYFSHARSRHFRLAIRRLSKIKLFRSIPPAHLDLLIQHLRHAHLRPGRSLFRQGDVVSRIYIIESGEIETLVKGEISEILGPGKILGETSFLGQQPVPYTAIVQTHTRVFELTRDDFSHIEDACPEIREILENESHHELLHDLGNLHPDDASHDLADEWAEGAEHHTHHIHYVPTQKEINENAEKHSAAPLSIWLGIFLDGIPESFVIGAGFLLILGSKTSLDGVGFTDLIPYTLIAGLFLSNLPEAMSSSIGMKKMGWKPFKILMLWTSLMIMTALGAIVGYYYGATIPNYVQIGIEGLAAGAMLTMIAQTMIPEAVHIGGAKVTGLSTLAGYMAAVAFKVLE